MAIKTLFKQIPKCYISVTAKYWNKSKQEFATTNDRIEVFEIINKKEA